MFNDENSFMLTDVLTESFIFCKYSILLSAHLKCPWV